MFVHSAVRTRSMTVSSIEIVIMKHRGGILIGCEKKHHVTSLAQSGLMPQAVF